MDKEIETDKNIEELARKYYRNNLQKICPPNFEDQYLQMVLSKEKSRSLLDTIRKYTQNKRPKILDVGCGLGGFISFSVKGGYPSVGVEPNASAVKITAKRGVCVIRGVGEKLPIKSGSFDVVLMWSVLEHVQSPLNVIMECRRVLKKGGMLFIGCANYMSFFESHYKVFWLPKFPRFFAKLYLRIRGRDTDFLRNIKYVTTSQILSIIASLGFDPDFRVKERINDPKKINRTSTRWFVLFIKKMNLIPLFEHYVPWFLPSITLGINPFSYYFTFIAFRG